MGTISSHERQTGNNMGGNMSDKAFHAIVHGRVQGVFFRQETHNKALALGITGWVRNLPDGTVEIWAEGSAGDLDKMAEWLKLGPPMALVSRMERTDQVATNDHFSFSMRS